MLNKPNIYLLGIGGIGMSGLARYFKSDQRKVFGYDRFRSELCATLEEEGHKIHYTDSPENIPKKLSADNTLVIYTPALPVDSAEMAYFTEQGFEIRKRAHILGAIAQNHTCLAVAGTHGKTTTSAILAHLFRHAGQNIVAFLGGLSTNYNTNYWGSAQAKILIAEADEFDRSFLNLKPAAAAITSTDADHLDIYGTGEALEETFQDFANSVTELLLCQETLTLTGGQSYGTQETSRYSALNIRVKEHSFVFDLQHPHGLIENISSRLPGKHNVENAVAAAGLALNYGLSPDEVKAGIESFKGVKRRFEYHIKTSDLVFIDDYAHHPSEINALADAVGKLYPAARITAIFQPHLFSRTRDFMAGFAEALSQFDEVILLDIYPARERPMPGITSAALLEKLQAPKKSLLTRQDILSRFKLEKPQVLLSIGAGDIDQLVQPLKLILLQ
jgi:UDP-N-acetylmuramate--alanine ligase